MTDIREISEAWIYKWRGDKPLALTQGFDIPEFDLEYGSTRDNPDLCLDVILDILTLIDAQADGRIFSVLAAGALENLLAGHGLAILERVDKEARLNPEFRLLLNGVWFDGIDPRVVSRLERYIAQRR